jgi:hypothetical protein
MRITEVLAKSKSNIPNDQELSQAEQELLKSMNMAEVFLTEKRIIFIILP